MTITREDVSAKAQRLQDMATAQIAERDKQKRELWGRIKTEAPDVAEHAQQMARLFGGSIVRLDLNNERVIDKPEARELDAAIARQEARAKRLKADLDECLEQKRLKVMASIRHEGTKFDDGEAL